MDMASLSQEWILQKAAAGTGKTTELTRTYLRMLSNGLSPSQIVTITFTRKAAAELKERVADVLMKLQEGRTLDGEDAPYAEVAPTDRKIIERALSELSAAPFGTIDSFVHSLLNRFALHAALPVGGDERVHLDSPLAAGGDIGESLEEAARTILSGAEKGCEQSVKELLRYYTLKEVQSLVKMPYPLERESTLLRFDEFCLSLGEALAQGHPDLRERLKYVLGLDSDPDTWREKSEPYIGAKLQKEPTILLEVLDWLKRETDDNPPDALITFVAGLKQVPDLHAAAVADPSALAQQIATATGTSSAALWVKETLGLATAADIEGLMKKAPKLPELDKVIAWLDAEDDALSPKGLDALPAKLKKKAAESLEATWQAHAQDTPDGLLARLKAESGYPSGASFITAQLKLRYPAMVWAEVIKTRRGCDGQEIADAVATYLQESADAAPLPWILAPFLGRLSADRETARLAAKGLDRVTLSVGGETMQLPLKKLFEKVQANVLSDPTRLESAERLRAHVDSLRAQSTALGLRDAARQGRLGHDELLRAATDTATRYFPTLESPPYQALLVDEVQDSSPAQLEFYQALATSLQARFAVFVGDSRQSIYGFRGAEPGGLHRLDDLCQKKVAPLETNYRSTEALVAGHRSLFSQTFAEALHEEGIIPLEDLSNLRAHDQSGAGAPIRLVCRFSDEDWETRASMKLPDADLAALQDFATQVRARWDAGDEASVAVLSPTWPKATAARSVLQALLQDGYPHSVFVDGGGRWLGSRTVRDTVIVLSALVDSSDSFAWLGFLKHPMVGLSDHALALIRNKPESLVREDGSPVASWMTQLGEVFLHCDGLVAPHLEADQEAFKRALGPIRAAVAAMGSLSTADVLDRLFTELGWREILAVAPEEDALAYCEMVLEWIRSLGNEGQSAFEIAQRLADAKDDQPKLALKRPAQCISCTSIFQSKGLKYGHVLVLSPGTGPKGGGFQEKRSQDVEVTIQDASGALKRLYGLRYDPDGAFKAVDDPMQSVVNVLKAARRQSEMVRLLYVAITRAAESVTLGLATSSDTGIHGILREQWADFGTEEAPKAPLEGTQWVDYPPPLALEALPSQWVRATDVPWAQPRYPAARWLKASPSSAERTLTPAGRGHWHRQIAERLLATQDGVQGPAYPDQAPPEAAYPHYTPADFGTMAHDFFAAWRFKGAPSKDLVQTFLKDGYGEAPDDLVSWLQGLSAAMMGHPSHPLWQLVTRPDVELYFELPMVGVATLGRDPDASHLLLSGRTDCLVRDVKKKAWTVVDFKAGSKGVLADPASPSDIDALVEKLKNAGLKTYGPQLEAYREALNGALAQHPVFEGETIEHVALWYVRQGSSLCW